MPTCRVCNLTYSSDDPHDRQLHRNEHKKLARGALPLHVREFLKAFGWAVAYNDGGLDRDRISLQEPRTLDPEIGKLAAAFSQWSRAVLNGAPERDFDDFMTAHLKFIDDEISGANLTQARQAKERWERYAG